MANAINNSLKTPFNLGAVSVTTTGTQLNYFNTMTGIGTGVPAALGVNIGSAGAFITYNGDAGTPSALVGTNITGTAAGLTAGSASAVAVGGITGLGTGVATALAVNVGSAGAFVTFNGAGGTPSSMVGTNITGTAAGLTAGTASAVAVGGITGLGTGVATALAINVGTAGSFITNGGALGTPSSGTLTNCTGLPYGGISAAAFSDISGSVTVSGFSGTPTVVMRQAVIGKICFLNFTISGTSNSISFTLGGLPNGSQQQIFIPILTVNASVNGFGLWVQSSTNVTLYINASSSTWTNTGTKAAYGQIFYEIA